MATIGYNWLQLATLQLGFDLLYRHTGIPAYSSCLGMEAHARYLDWLTGRVLPNPNKSPLSCVLVCRSVRMITVWYAMIYIVVECGRDVLGNIEAMNCCS